MTLRFASDFTQDIPMEVVRVGEPENGQAVVVLSTASPFKFPGAVLKALGGDRSGDAFAQMDRLSRLAGVEIPGNLSGLKAKVPLHRDSIEKDGLTDYVLRVLSEREGF